MVSAFCSPGAVKVIGHQVDKVEIVGRYLEINKLQNGFAGWQICRENVMILGQVNTNGRQQSKKVVTLLGITWIFPCNYVECQLTILLLYYSSALSCCRDTHCRFRPSQMLRRDLGLIEQNCPATECSMPPEETCWTSYYHPPTTQHVGEDASA